MTSGAASNSPLARDLWRQVQRRLLAKTIGELSYEEALRPVADDDYGTSRRYRIELPGGVRYHFRARFGIWGQLTVEPDSILRSEQGLVAPADDCARFFTDAREPLGMSAATVCHYIRELHQTALADVALATINRDMDADALIDLSPELLQCRLDGHPKAPASKGRLGWGYDDYLAYGPEALNPFRLVWLAVHRSRVRLSLAPELDEQTLWERCLGRDGRRAMQEAFDTAGVSTGDYLPLPVHPWQWRNMLIAQFAGAIAGRLIVPLAFDGDRYLPQASLRTVVNHDAPGRLDVKLSLSILNTSCYRGIPGRYIEAGPVLSRWLAAKCGDDDELAVGTVILEELAGAFCPHPDYARIEDAPYQFHEMLGAIWRESVVDKIPPNRTAVMLGALLQRDTTGRPLVSAYIARSGLSPADWVARLFEAVVVPLYHLMCRYGVALVAHGQNLTLILERHVPVGVALKDLQGDCRLVDRDFAELDDLPASVRSTLTRLPPEYLLHDLYTGHFVTVLRFVSDLLADAGDLDELHFYAVLARVLRDYQQRHPELAERFALFDLFQPTMLRICVNRVRFRIGYGDDAQRPLPELGSPINNPLYIAERAQLEQPAKTGERTR